MAKEKKQKIEPQPGKPKKPIYKRWWFWLIVVFVFAVLFVPSKDVKQTDAGEAPVAATPAQEPTADQDQTQKEPVPGKDISDKYILFDDSVRNDKTGRWRLARCSAGVFIPDYAVSYYRTYFKADDEVHVFIDFGLKTTAVITAGSGNIYISIYEYVDKEEHDASLIPAGQKLGSYIVDIQTGEVTEA